ncbi:tail fiber domain-containing protein [Winogradskyella psychrotolerans]|uniref:tail fiber domain-containing protein n=1 Tax=Winogradskyella psychrotolerans TaxID=1344585 RepID=UPI001C06EFB3|nr:tail fiber domain-containing protein [Winogradskyella psychrotolerans]MBU2930137.1 tail fiber domain-containing protein [Winogradskyella psychrotolerans]
MKTKLTLLFWLLFSILIFGQDRGFNYKALIKDANGNILSNQTVKLRFTIFYDNNDIYKETQSPTTDANGIVIVSIGEGTPFGGVTSFSSVSSDFGNNDYFLKVEIDINGGNSFVDMGSSRFNAVPYAKYAERAGNAVNRLNQLLDAKSDDDFNANNGSSIFLGRLAGYEDHGTGNKNTSVGYASMQNNTTGNGNIAFGYEALHDNQIGYNNTAIGKDALSNTTEGAYNVAIGYGSGQFNYGNNNVFIGNEAGHLPTSIIESDKLYINNERSNSPLIYGEFDNDLIRINGTLDISEKLDIGGSLTIKNASDDTSSWRLETRPNGSLSLYRNGDYRGYFSESTGVYSSISDRRLKNDIKTLEKGTLLKVMQLNPVSYLMKDQTDTKRNLGLISQEVQKIFPSITNYVEEADLITLSYTELIPILIKALQEQQNIIEAQKAKDIVQDTSISKQSQTIKSLVARLDHLEAKSSN